VWAECEKPDWLRIPLKRIAIPLGCE